MMYVHNQEIAREDEIDLIALLFRLWEGKRVIAVWVILGILLGGFVAWKKNSVYPVTATIDIAQPQDLLQIQPSPVQLKGSAIVPPLTTESIYGSVVLQAPSVNLLKLFWNQYSKENADSLADMEFKSFVKGFKLVPVNAKQNESTSRYVSAEFENPKVGALVLGAYLEFLNKTVQRQVLDMLRKSYEAGISTIDSDIQVIEANDQKKLLYDLDKLNENLKIAQSLKIEDTPFKDLENIELKLIDGRDYLLGAKALSQQINLLTERRGKSMVPYDPELINLTEAKAILKADLDRINQFKSIVNFFRVESLPEAALEPKGPGSAIVLLGVTFAFFFIGVLQVLLTVAITNYKQSKTA